jgi:putative Mg2+ transporter-C (MgtC) family protein
MQWEQMVALNGNDLIKLVAAFLAGVALGAEREYHDKSAGMRTIILICVGSAMFTIFSVQIADDKDPGRVAAQIVSGIGFLGAGVILVRRGQVLGLTTASTIWVAAAIGIGMGVGNILFTAIATVLVIFVLGILPSFERIFQRAASFKTYKITVRQDPTKPARLRKAFTDAGLSVREESRAKAKDTIVLLWQVAGRPSAHQRMYDLMLNDPEIQEFEH